MAALDEQIAHLRQLIAHLRQLAVTDPETGAVDQAFINALDELAGVCARVARVSSMSSAPVAAAVTITIRCSARAAASILSI